MGLQQLYLPVLLTVSSALLARADSGFGNLFYLGPWSSSQPSDPYITNATYSLVVPDVLTDYDTSDTSLWASIWVGVQPNTDDAMSADLVQPLLNWCVDQEGCGCPASSSEWCVMASTYTAEGQLGDSYIAIETGATLDFQIYLDGDKISQKVLKAGEVISQRSDSSFKPGTLYGANECSSTSCGTLTEYSWTNLTMTFSEAVTDLDDYVMLAGASASTLESSEGGKVWKWSKITIDQNEKGDWSN